ncbi:GNAT family N-acetyltransferase [Streptomyces sp. SID3343]|uniref:GNAT family N-acetyltransferase n=1 Tax=Streptomyces sp. SID3343 TaxID=2690260 RepID=UPI00136A76E9|nr:GNAT family N-acetyltransferase [Streptomyces sp. SID3343]MYW03881.1 GNAT family N-acetyltransferase [Streptomyces sp. SID3343]
MTTPVRLAAIDLVTHTPSLAELLVDAVDDGASVGFLAPLAVDEAAEWWATQTAAIRSNRTVIWATQDATGITGTIQLQPAFTPNGRHRAELTKLLVHRRARGNGLARELLSTAEQFAAASGRTLLTLDTRSGSAAERLYKNAGWTESGTIPDYAADPAGRLQPTTLFHKHLG